MTNVKMYAKKGLKDLLWIIFFINTVFWIILTARLIEGVFYEPFGIKGIIVQGVKVLGKHSIAVHKGEFVLLSYEEEMLCLSQGYLEYISLIYLQMLLIYLLFLRKSNKCKPAGSTLKS